MRVLIPVLLFFFVSRSAAGMIVETGSTVVIDHAVFEDIYLAGGTITVNAPVHGDIVAAGGTIYVNDTVFDEVLIAGANVTINGYVAGKIRCIGGTLRIGQSVNGDLVIAGGTVSLEHNAIVAGSVLATGGNIILNGPVKGNIHAAAASLRLYDSVGGNLDFHGATLEINAPVGGTSTLMATRRIDIGTNAAFSRDVRYWTPTPVDFSTSLKDATATIDTSLRPRESHWYFLGAVTFWNVFWFLGMALAEIILVQLLATSWLRKAGASLSTSTIRSLGAGFLWIFGVPVLIILLCFTAIAIPIAAVMLLGYISVWIFCSGLTATVAANWLNSRRNNAWRFWRLVWVAFGCSILLRLIVSIPLAGWLVAGVATCLAFGSILINISWKKPSVT